MGVLAPYSAALAPPGVIMDPGAGLAYAPATPGRYRCRRQPTRAHAGRGHCSLATHGGPGSGTAWRLDTRGVPEVGGTHSTAAAAAAASYNA